MMDVTKRREVFLVAMSEAWKVVLMTEPSSPAPYYAQRAVALAEAFVSEYEKQHAGIVSPLDDAATQGMPGVLVGPPR